MKFIHYTFLLFSLLITSCYTPSGLYAPEKSPVVFKFEEGSKVIKETYCTSLEKTKEGVFLFKRYYPTTNVLTEEISYQDSKMTIKNGQQINYYDDGKLWKSITYKNDIAEGAAVEETSFGNYKSGFRFGNWQTYREGVKVMSYNYNEKGEIHGQDTSWTETGELISIRTFKENELIDEKIFIEGKKVNRIEVVEVMPLFPSENCDNIEDAGDRKSCSDKEMLGFIYRNIKYPTFARVNDIQGTATISFVVEKNGLITDVKALNGVCDEIKAECLRIVNEFPDFYPGYQNDEAVRVQFNLPVRFRLE